MLFTKITAKVWTWYRPAPPRLHPVTSSPPPWLLHHTRVASLTLGVHVHRGSQHLVCVSVISRPFFTPRKMRMHIRIWTTWLTVISSTTCWQHTMDMVALLFILAKLMCGSSNWECSLIPSHSWPVFSLKNTIRTLSLRCLDLVFQCCCMHKNWVWEWHYWKWNMCWRSHDNLS